MCGWLSLTSLCSRRYVRAGERIGQLHTPLEKDTNLKFPKNNTYPTQFDSFPQFIYPRDSQYLIPRLGMSGKSQATG